MSKFLLCSDCFYDQGLKLDARQIGTRSKAVCPNCHVSSGAKLNTEQIENLAYRYFVIGSYHRPKYGGYPTIQFNSSHFQQTSIKTSRWLVADVKVIAKTLNVGFFYYGPRYWMFGEVEPLKELLKATSRQKILNRIIKEYPISILSKKDVFYRIRKNIVSTANSAQFDSPPKRFLGSYRLDSPALPIFYASQDLEVCVHECRVRVEDELYVATVKPTRKLKLLDLTGILQEDTTEFESLDMAVHMLFSAGGHAYKITRAIAITAKANGFDGIIYPSFFSLARSGAVPFATLLGMSLRKLPPFKKQVESHTIPNIALFGRPITEGIVKVKCIDKLIVNKVAYHLSFGPLVS